jgi:hypothetical protein
MNQSSKLVDLGFAAAKLPAGTHICQIYSDDDERNDSLLRFLTSGLLAGECTACFSEKVDEESLAKFFAGQGLSLDDAKQNGSFSLGRTADVYFQNNCFDPDVMLELLRNYHQNAVDKGFPAARVIGEMSPEINRVAGGSRLMEYEARVSMLLRDHPVTAVCQYNAHEFDGATLMDVLKVHPMMVVRGSVIHNPFYVLPEEYLQGIKQSP